MPQPPTDTFAIEPDDPSLLRSGRVVDRYVIEGVLGSGGMAQVYRVRHRTLGSEHALKVLTAPSPEVRKRLLHEGRSQAQLAHSNVVSVTDVVDVDGQPGLILELVRGPTLREVLQAGPLTFDQARQIGAHILRGVDAAHRIGLVHRDLKPSNVLLELRDEGVVAMVSDFGLVKALHGDGADSGAQTRSGVALGTPAYMAPEQLDDPRGVDHRADVFSLGAVLYEMVTGARAFRGEGLIGIAFQIAQGNYTPPRDLVPDLPEEMERAIVGSLVVDPAERIQDARSLLAAWLGTSGGDSSSVGSEAQDPELLARARDAAEGHPALAPTIDLGAPPISTAAPPEASMVAPPPKKPILPWVVVALLAIVAGVALWRSAPPAPTPAAQPRLSRLTFEPGPQHFGALSPDGRQVVYSDNVDLFLRRVEGDRAINLTESIDAPAREPSFSPDGEHVAFFADGLYLMGATGENPQRVADGGSWPAWSPDGRRVAFGSLAVADTHHRTESGSQLRIFDRQTREVSTIVAEGDALNADWRPDGERLVYGGILGVFTVRPDGSERKQLHVGSWSPRWTADGDGVLLLRRRGSATEVVRLPVDRRTGEASGEAAVLYTMALGFAKQLDRSADGSRWLLSVADPAPRVREWVFDGALGAELKGSPDRSLQPSSPSRSSDGTALAFTSSGEQEDLYVLRAEGMTRLSRGERFTRGPVWHPSGERILFYGARVEGPGLYSIKPDGGDLRALAVDPERPLMLPAISPDGGWLVASFIGERPYLFDLHDDGTRVTDKRPLGGPDGWVATAWSPDGASLAVSDAKGGLGVMDVMTGQVERVDAEGYWAAFAPDGRLVVAEEGRVFTIEEDGTTEPLLELDGERIQRDPPLRVEGGRLLLATEQTEADLWMVELDAVGE